MTTQGDLPRTVCGRLIGPDDLEQIRQIIASDPSAHRLQISRTVCQAWSWFKPDGGLKEMSCRVLLLKLHRSGLITLPEPRQKNVNGKKYLRRTEQGEAQEPITGPLQALLPLELHRVRCQKDSSLWNELIERYHYLGYKPLPGAQIRYLVYASSRCLCAIGFSAAAWKVQPRDAWIGWSSESRKQNLHRVVNNSRFLILPWVRCKLLASKILSLCAQRLPDEWQDIYGYRPVLLETFVEKDRFAGTCYKAANWSCVGSTQGRGKLDRLHEHKLPVKDIYLYPLDKRFRRFLI